MIHAQQQLGEVLSVRASFARLNRDVSGVAVLRAGQHRLQFGFGELLVERCDQCDRIVSHVFAHFGELNHDAKVFGPFDEFGDRLDRGVELLELVHRGLSLLLVVPEVWLRHARTNLGDALLLGSPVKESRSWRIRAISDFASSCWAVSMAAVSHFIHEE